MSSLYRAYSRESDKALMLGTGRFRSRGEMRLRRSFLMIALAMALVRGPAARAYLNYRG